MSLPDDSLEGRQNAAGRVQMLAMQVYTCAKPEHTCSAIVLGCDTIDVKQTRADEGTVNAVTSRLCARCDVAAGHMRSTLRLQYRACLHTAPACKR